MRHAYLWLPLVAILCAACSANYPSGCLPPPTGFSTTDLAGTWHAGSKYRNDTLIVRADGTYKQITYVEELAFDYKSDWQPWRLEYSDDGVAYLHLTGMRLCFYSGSCTMVGGGSGKDDKYYDDCQRQWILMPGEGVLLVLGRPGLNAQTPQPPHVVDLVLLRKGEDSWAYRKEAIPVPTVEIRLP
jgi:hypothetical protein